MADDFIDMMKQLGFKTIKMRAPEGVVVCDICNDNHTKKDEEGGILFGSKAICPTCTARMMPDIKAYHEEEYIVAECPKGTSFRQFVLNLRLMDRQTGING